jgi:hypothetical protein
MSYGEFKPIAMYTNLIPPECKIDKLNFTKKGDVYFYGWILVELLLEKPPETYNFEIIKDQISNYSKVNDTKESMLKHLIFRCLDQVTFFFQFLKILIFLRILIKDLTFMKF